MKARQKYIKLLERLIKSPFKNEIRKSMDSLVSTNFETCFQCKKQFVYKRFADEIPANNELICPNCRA